MAERELDHDRKVALEQLPRKLRQAFSALWFVDLAFADVIATSTDPRLGQIRLAWWRERLEDLDRNVDRPSEPRLTAVANELVPRGVTGSELARLEDAWLPLLDPFPWSAPQAEGLQLRGELLFGLGGRLLGEEDETLEAAGRAWSLIDGAQHCSDPVSRNFLLDEARALPIPGKAPQRLRALTVLAVVAASDIRIPATSFSRGIAAAQHRLTGRFPRP